MKLIVGLGNPGRGYRKTRHNVGFMVLDELTQKEQIKFNKKAKFKSEVIQTTIYGESVVLLKPTTFMNLSGEAVSAVKNFYNIDNSDILVIHDDLDLECGKVRVRQKGSSGGHNGLKSIINSINGKDFHRLKIGIDRDSNIPVKDYVLGKFTKEQIQYVSDAILISFDIIYDWLTRDVLYVMNKYNGQGD